MSKTLTWLIVLSASLPASGAGAQASSQSQPSREASWRARRTADSVCATYPLDGGSRRDPVSGAVCRKSQPPTLTAFVLTDHLICPSATPWNDTNPLTLLNVERIARIEFRRDSLTFAKWRCPSPVDAVVIVTAKPTSGS
jgi:hypothetical protein